ncbi:hypothetical protein [Rhodococcoides kyotonense]|uniref:Uncharacterized protein n=1 Tax=Rhodococcoides kyotonense TaxID=398843 RepID=A0A239N5N6_9NOCA|nr:hypothetical protein [Rhodococcus kyotonensis]SNT49764.1 hypothetical protein SAMN05421642_12932 [Rhodococcus kyotonensis]
MSYTAANHYVFEGDELTGTFDTNSLAGVAAAQFVLNGVTLESTEATRTDLGYEIRAIVERVHDGTSTHLLAVVPRVNIENDPVTFGAYAVLFTSRGNIAGDRYVHGALESYDVRTLNGTASLVDS